MMTPL